MKHFFIFLLGIVTGVYAFAQNVVQGEYFVDTDLGYGKNVSVSFTPSADNSFAMNINLSSYQPGSHNLFFRIKDSDGKWSLTSKRNIVLLSTSIKTSVLAGEYFIDTDPGFGNGNPISITSPDSIILQNFSAIASGLPEGSHKLYGRLKDNVGNWSLTLRRNIEIYKSDANKVLNGEYFFKVDQGFGSCSPVDFAIPAADGSFTMNIARNTIPAGADTIFVRVRDDVENRWSITAYSDLSTVLPLTLINLTATKDDNNSIINWQTANEVNTDYFNIQRSIDGQYFSTVGKVNAKLNPGLQNDYSYTDDITDLQTGKIFYRLQIIDHDNNSSFSKIVYLVINNNDLPIKLYPNPAHGYFVISNYKNVDVRTESVMIKDISGRTILTQRFNNNSSEQRVDISSLSKGMYLVNIITSGEIQTKKLLIK